MLKYNWGDLHIVNYTINIRKIAGKRCFVIHAIRNGKEESYSHYIDLNNIAQEIAKFTNITQKRLADMTLMEDIRFEIM